MTTKPRGRKTPAPAPAPEPTPASEWNKTGLYQMPSGNVAKLRRPGVLATAAASNGRNLVTDAALLKLKIDGAAPTTDAERAAIIRANCEAYCEVARLCFVEPRISVVEPDYAAGEISITDVEDIDLEWVFFEFVHGGAAYAAQFRVG